MPAFRYLGGDHGKGLLESALAQPSQTFGGRFLYRTIFDKAAVLLCSIIKNHSLVDGNKRTALTTMGVFLAVNGYFFYAQQDEAVQRCLSVAATKGNVDWREISRWIRPRSISVQVYRAMLPNERKRWARSVGLLIIFSMTRLTRIKVRIERLNQDSLQ
ncbi:MAG: type II toxin-antitoxin system death-on-curing family toxin [Dehalococcoidia bacterium]|nr:type II toxin-antitoxin system death-on-curing family toxin [Dehalococcoidia bacterium]MSQ16444.1 type II toxin-antitoxin system death-on-curing family toxin [Dehalococcoidia bacterium]